MTTRTLRKADAMNRRARHRFAAEIKRAPFDAPPCRSARGTTRPAKNVGAARTLHLIDIENLCGSGVLTDEMVETMWRRYAAAVPIGPTDCVVVAVGRRNGLALFGLPAGVRRLIGVGGADSADHALLEAAQPTWTSSRFGRVTIASADHIFAARARELAAAGVDVDLVIATRAANALWDACGRRATRLSSIDHETAGAAA